MNRDLIFIGCGGGTREAIPFIDDINHSVDAKYSWRVVGILDDNPQMIGRQINGISVLGTTADLDRYREATILIGAANSKNILVRRKIYERLSLPADRYATLIHPLAYVSPSAVIEHGCVIYPHVCIGPDVVVGYNSVVYFNSVIHHDSRIGPHAAICAGVCVAGNVTLGQCSYIGIAATIRDGITVGEESLVGMGSVVVQSVPKQLTVCGVPARLMEAGVHS